MLYITSFHLSDSYPGEKYAVSHTLPRGKNYKKVQYLTPPWKLIMAWKQQEISQDQFVQQYMQLLEGSCHCYRSRQEPHQVRQHLEAIKAEVENGRDIVLASWEPPGEFSYRQVLARYLVSLGLDEKLIKIE